MKKDIAAVREALEYGQQARPRSPMFPKAMAALAALEASLPIEGGEAWTDRDIDVAYWIGAMNGGAHEATGKTYWPSMDRLMAEAERIKDHGIDVVSMVRTILKKTVPPPRAEEGKLTDDQTT